MPDPVTIAALIGGGAQLLGGGINAFSQGNMNRKNRRWSLDMYNRQRSDNLSNWFLQNQYNSPQAQMERFQAAGLNPNLIYGQGNSGPAGAVAPSNPDTPQTRAPEWGGGLQSAGLTAVNAMYDLEIKKATADNLKSQGTVIAQEALLKQAQTRATEVGANRGQFNLDFESEFRDISGDARRESLRQLKTNTDLAINRDAREALTNSSNLQEAAQRMLSMQVQRIQTGVDTEQKRAEIARIRENVRLMQQDGTLKSLDIQLRRAGIMPHDPMYARVGARLLPDLIDKGKSALTEFWDWINK